MRNHLIFLIGYRGTGKTTVARALAQRLGWAWCDADALLEDRHRITIRQIFQQEGEASFRDKETAMLEELATRRQCVIATGGGVVLRPENRARLRRGVTIWLTAPADVLWQRLQQDAATAERRPNLAQGGLAEIEEQLRLRRPHYQECADWTVDASAHTPEQIAEQTLAWLREKDAIDIVKP
jgi:shikimate kinase